MFVKYIITIIIIYNKPFPHSSSAFILITLYLDARLFHTCKYIGTLTPKARWLISPPLTPQAKESLAAFSPILSQILFNRGYATDAAARACLRGKPTSDTSPWQMRGIRPAVERIRYALDHAEPIAIYGDYDVDGVTVTALLVQTLRALGGDAHEYIPNRFDEGYGLNPEALDSLKEQGVKLVITVDCGIRSPDEAAR
jgi:single-stranded-DNA-specific exonuclease